MIPPWGGGLNKTRRLRIVYDSSNKSGSSQSACGSCHEDCAEQNSALYARETSCADPPDVVTPIVLETTTNMMLEVYLD